MSRRSGDTAIAIGYRKPETGSSLPPGAAEPSVWSTDTQTPAPPGTAVPQRTRSALAIACYLGLSLYATWPALLGGSTRIVGEVGGDAPGQANALAWTLFVLSHHVGPFFSTYINAPAGISVADNASAPLLGLIASPLTAAFGPFVALNLVVTAGFFLAATSMFLVLRGRLSSTMGPFLGGLCYGFSAYVVGQSLGHVAIFWVALLPVIVHLMLETLTAATQRRARRAGTYLGVALVAQFYIAEELLADLAIVTVVVLLAVALRHPRSTWEQLVRSASGIATALGIALVLVAYPVWLQVLGPDHLSGPAQPVSSLDHFHADLLSLVVPLPLERLAPGGIAAVASSWWRANLSEAGSYVGIPLLELGLLAVVWLSRKAVVRIAALAGLVAYVLSLGTRLSIAGQVHPGIPLPFALLAHLPLLDSAVPGRFSLLTQLSMAALVAFGIDAIVTGARARLSSGALAPRKYRATIALSWVLVASVMATVLPAFPLPVQDVTVPAFFSTRAVEAIPQGSVLLAYPYPQPGVDDPAMLWQTASGFRFRLVGGYAVFRDASGNGTIIPPPLQPLAMQDLFGEAWNNSASPPQLPPGPPVILDRATDLELATFLHRYRIETVAVDPIGFAPQLVIKAMTTLLGRPRQVDGVELWLGVPRRLADWMSGRPTATSSTGTG